jgi:hypothetical protein
MSWILFVYEKLGEAFVSELPLPDSIDDDVVKSLVGDYPNLHGDSFPVELQSLDRLADEYSIEVEPDGFDYFIEFRS